MDTYDLFPVLVGSDSYSEHEEFKKAFFDNIHKYTREDGITGEASGHVDLHTNPDFEKFFQYVSGVCNEYVSKLVGTEDIWDLWLVKTWFSDFNVPMHDHADAHLSFVYYVNVPEEKNDPIHFFQPKGHLNDLTNGMFLPTPTIPAVKEHNHYNCSAVTYPALEGNLLIFPSKLYHAVESHKTFKPTVTIKGESAIMRRISLAGDFILTFKENTARSMGLQPISNWRKF